MKAATFAINTYTISSSAGANGSISPSGSTSVNYNGSQTYTITPNTGYQIDSVTVDGISHQIVDNEYEASKVFGPIDADLIASYTAFHRLANS